MEGLGGGGVVTSAFGDVQVAGVLDGRDDGGADGGQVGGPAPGPAGRGVFAERGVPYMVMRLYDQCSRTSRARSGVVACALVRVVTA